MEIPKTKLITSALNQLLKTVIFSNLFVALSVAAFTHLTYIVYDLHSENSWILITMVFCFTFTTYNGQRLFRLKSKVRSYTSVGERLIWVLKHQKALTYTSLFLGLIGGICILFINPLCWILLIPMGFLSLFYVVPVPIINKSLRDTPYLKVLIIAFVWSLIVVGMPILNTPSVKIIPSTFLIALLQGFLFIVAITIPFDVRDMKFDRVDQLKTFPLLLGVKGTITVSSLLLLCSLACFHLLIPNPIIQIGLAIGHLITVAIIALTNEKRGEFFFAGWVESTVILVYLSVQITTLIYSL